MRLERQAENKKSMDREWDDDHSYSNLFLVRKKKPCRPLASIPFRDLRRLEVFLSSEVLMNALVR